MIKNFLERSWSRRDVTWILVVVVALAAGLRLWQLGNVPLNADEFLDVNATYGYYKTGVWQAWDFNHDAPSVRDNKASDERAWLYRWQVAQMYRVLPLAESTARVVSALWGIITTVLIYGVTVSLLRSRAIGVVAAFLWAVSVPAIEINRAVRMYSMFAPVFLMLWWSAFRFVEHVPRLTIHPADRVTLRRVVSAALHVNWAYAIVVVVMAVLALHLHPLAGNLALMVVGYFFWMAVVSRAPLMRWRYVVYLGVCAAGAVACAVFLPSVWVQLASGMVFFDDHWGYLAHLARSYWHPLIAAAALVGGSVALVRFRDVAPAGAWLVSTFIVGLTAAIFLWDRNVGAQYIFFLQPLAMMVAAAGVVAAARWMARATRRRAAFIGTLLVAALLLPYYGYFFQKNTTYHITMTADRANYRKVFTYVRDNAKPGDVMITRNFRNFYWRGMGIPVFDFGSERDESLLAKEGKVKKITAVYVQEIMVQHPRGWVVLADNDNVFVEKAARAYLAQHATAVTDSDLVRGKVTVYHWDLHGGTK